jgi:hypothetical protein
MNGLNPVGVAHEGLQRRRLIGPEERGQIVLWRIPRRTLALRKRVVQLAPDPCNRVQRWTVWGQADEAHVRGADEPLGGVRATVVQEQEIQAVREGLCKGIDAELQALGVQIRRFQEDASTRRGRHGAIAREPLKDGRHPTCRETAAADGQQAEAAFVMAADMDGASIGGRNRLLQVAPTARLEG